MRRDTELAERLTRQQRSILRHTSTVTAISWVNARSTRSAAGRVR